MTKCHFFIIGIKLVYNFFINFKYFFMQCKFTIGDVVELKSGGPEMTVTDVTTRSAFDGSERAFDGRIHTVWFDDKNNKQGGTFHQDTLDLIED